MSERLSDVDARIGSVHQLSAVITAMRGIAAARSREARNHLDGIRAYAEAIAAAIAQGLAMATSSPDDGAPATDRRGRVIVAFCTEQGFAGSFNERILEAAATLADLSSNRPAHLFLLGDRGTIIAAEKSLNVEWSAPMIAHLDQTADLAGRIVDALFTLIDHGAICEVIAVYAAPDIPHVIQRRLIPFDYDRFREHPVRSQPLTTLEPRLLVEGLAEEYIFAELCEAITLSFAAENEARTRAMIAAKTNVSKTLDTLTGLSRQLRQEQITSELIELSSGSAIR